MDRPKVSVIIPVYNGARYLRESTESILDQSFKDFELLLINDGSTDETLAIMRSYHDSRIRILNNTTNTGLASVRNKGILESKGEYVAWLDADDISMPERLEKQVSLLDKNPEIGICGTYAKIIGTQKSMEWRYPTDPDVLSCHLLFYDPIITSSAILRKKILAENNLLFNPAYPPAEDYDLWERMSRHCSIINIPEVLTSYRIHESQTSSARNDAYKLELEWEIQLRRLRMLGINPTEEQKAIHQIIARMEVNDNYQFLKSAEEWLLVLKKANLETEVFPQKLFMEMLGGKWLTILMGANKSKYNKVIKILRSPFHATGFKIFFLYNRIVEELTSK
jgi:glycosyltransferase involved in cell wall biosynthesis